VGTEFCLIILACIWDESQTYKRLPRPVSFILILG